MVLKVLFTKIRILAIVLGIAGLVSISGCWNSSGANGDGNNLMMDASAITIDNAGVIPVFGNSSTSTVVYVHNNTKNTISGIDYSITYNDVKDTTNFSGKSSSGFKENKSLSAVSDNECSTIAAGKSCPLSIVTPIITALGQQGSMNIKASYRINNKMVEFNQIINYEQVRNNQQISGAKFQSGVNISGYGNPTGHATIYLYGSGQNQVYEISSMVINKPAITIENGNISGHQIKSNFVQAVEVSSPILASSISATITVNSDVLDVNEVYANKVVAKGDDKGLNGKNKFLVQSQFNDSDGLLVEPVTSGAILTTGLIPLLNTINGTSGSMLVQNSGNQDAVVGSITGGLGISDLSGCAGEILAPAASCRINFSVTEAGGSANIIVLYTGGSASSITSNVTWFNGRGAALVSMFGSSNPLTFSATIGGSTMITVTNIGGYRLSNISIPPPIILGGSATAVISNDTCSNQTLAINASCIYEVNVADNTTDLNQQINLGFNASYAGSGGVQTYSRVMPLMYSSTAYGAIIAITPIDSSLAISGNNLESATQVFTISNSGHIEANISSILSGNPAYLSQTSTSCSATLLAESSCTSTLKLGPTFSIESINGVSMYTVEYTVDGQIDRGSVSSLINWSVNSGEFIFFSLANNGNFSCALGNNGYSYCWGSGSAGQIGNGIDLDSNQPAEVIMPNGIQFTQVSTNQNFSCALGDDYAAYCWGVGTGGQIGNGHNKSVNVPTKVVMPGGLKFAQISTNTGFSCALTRVGKAFCWGDSTNGHIGNGTEKDIKNTPQEVTLPPEVKFTQISTNPNFSCALGTDSSTYCWGYGESGQIGNGQNSIESYPAQVIMPSGVIFTKISTNSNYTCALANDASIYCWGNGIYGQLGNGTSDMVNIPTKVVMPNGIQFKSIVTSEDFSCALDSLGEIYCWGYGAAGRLGNGNNLNVNIPTKVVMPLGILFHQISIGSNSGCGLGDNMSSYCWGGGTNGKIGNGANNNVFIPTLSLMPSGIEFSTIMASQYTNCAITSVGSIYCWGSGMYGRIGNGGYNDVNVPTGAIMPY